MLVESPAEVGHGAAHTQELSRLLDAEVGDLLFLFDTEDKMEEIAAIEYIEI